MQKALFVANKIDIEVVRRLGYNIKEISKIST